LGSRFKKKSIKANPHKGLSALLIPCTAEVLIKREAVKRIAQRVKKKKTNPLIEFKDT
jgi:hypothetical protein